MSHDWTDPWRIYTAFLLYAGGVNINSSPKQVHTGLIQLSWWPLVTDPDLGSNIKWSCEYYAKDPFWKFLTIKNFQLCEVWWLAPMSFGCPSSTLVTWRMTSVRKLAVNIRLSSTNGGEVIQMALTDCLQSNRYLYYNCFAFFRPVSLLLLYITCIAYCSRWILTWKIFMIP